MATAEDLGKLIIMMNPYTNGSDHLMEPHTFINAPEMPGLYTSPPTTSPPSTSPPTSGADPRQIWMEMDAKYPGEWSFKGQPHRVSRALRIAYRWAKTDDNGNVLCWITDYLLVGFEGSGGGE